MAWLKTDPFNNNQAPPDPIFMSDYHNAKHEQFLALGKQAADVGDRGYKIGRDGRPVCTNYGSVGDCTFNHSHRTTLPSQSRMRGLYDSCLAITLPAALAIADAAPHPTGTLSVTYLISAKGTVSC
jgi:hypothetical protein